jgi:hypothetical protein
LKRLQAGAPVSDPASAKWLGDAGSETGAPEGVKCSGREGKWKKGLHAWNILLSAETIKHGGDGHRIAFVVEEAPAS